MSEIDTRRKDVVLSRSGCTAGRGAAALDCVSGRPAVRVYWRARRGVRGPRRRDFSSSRQRFEIVNHAAVEQDSRPGLVFPVELPFDLRLRDRQISNRVAERVACGPKCVWMAVKLCHQFACHADYFGLILGHNDAASCVRSAVVPSDEWSMN